MHPLVQSIIEMDQLAFKVINSDWSNSLLDLVMPILTDLHRIGWLTHYVLPAVLVLWLALDRKNAALTILGLILSIALSDSLSYRLIKENVKRERPEFCVSGVRLLTHSHSGYSFPSIHAANIMAAAAMIRYMYPFLRTVVYLLAFFIGYSRIYVGVHFPLDVVGGMLTGYFCAFLTIYLGILIKPNVWNYELPWFAKKNDP